ncbi:hypothetical protein L3Q82_008926, partial [Scortum barcoo]
LTVQTLNLNETNVLGQTQSIAPSQNEDGGGRGLIQKASPSNSRKDLEEEREKEGHAGSVREEEEEEDIDEVMKEIEEEEESEGSSCLIRCQSPDTPMTDSSYSETGSLLETPYPFSPGTSPEPTSPLVPAVSPETAYPIGQVELTQSDVKVDSHNSKTEAVASSAASNTLGPTLTTGLIDTTAPTVTSDTRPTSSAGFTCITEAKNTNFTAEHLTSSTEPIFNNGLTCAGGFASLKAGPNASSAETCAVTACTTRLNTSSDSTPVSTTTGPLTFITGSTNTSAESPPATGPITSNWEHVTSAPVPTCSSVSTCATGHTQSPALLESLEQLAQRGDDTNFPQYLHQIAEAFVLEEDYQRALWCIQLERLYHQRVLDNLNALQDQWEGQCRRTSSDLATHRLDTLRHICQTHSRSVCIHACVSALFAYQELEMLCLECLWCASLDLRPTFEDGAALPSCTSARQVDGGMEQRAKDSSSSQSSHPIIPSINLADELNSPEISGKGREDPDGELEEGEGFHESQLTDKREGSDRDGGETEGGAAYTISAIGKELHPSTAAEMDQSKPAEQQGGDLGLTQEKEAKREGEQSDVEEAAEALEMEDDGEDEEEEKREERNSPFCQKALPVETLVSGAEVEVQQLHQEAQTEEKLHEETQLQLQSIITAYHQESHLHQEGHMKEQEQGEEGKEEYEDEEYEYEVEQADIIREAASLDDMAKLITVEETSPASGLVSILKKRHVCVDSRSVSASSETRHEKPPAKRRVRFKFPDDSYEQGIAIGLIVKTNFNLSDIDKIHISFPGEMLFRLLQLVTVPLIVTSVITGKIEVYLLIC